MKTETLLIVAAAAAGLYFISKVAKSIGNGTSPASTGADHAAAVPMGFNIPNAAMSLADQYKAYGAGRDVSSVYDQTGYLSTTN